MRQSHEVRMAMVMGDTGDINKDRGEYNALCLCLHFLFN